MTTNSNREAFEKWWDRLFYPPDDYSDLYPCSHKSAAANAWQAATAHNKEKLREVRDAIIEYRAMVRTKFLDKAIATLNEMIGGE